ncbi:ribosomal prt L32 [Nucleospora cyclopteri]
MYAKQCQIIIINSLFFKIFLLPKMSDSNKSTASNLKDAMLEYKNTFKKRVFKRYHSDRYKRVSVSWRKPRGLDNRVRKKYSGTPLMPNKRFRQPEILRNLLQNGLREVVVKNLEDLRALSSLNNKYCATIGKAVGARKRITLINEARVLGVEITNKEGRIVEGVPQ